MRITLSLCLISALFASCAPLSSPTAALPESATPLPSATAIPSNTPTSIPLPTETPTIVSSETPVPPSEEALAWLRLHAIGFDTAEPGTGCLDLQPLLEMIGEARIVALGEASHGTHEFFTMKQRIIECLVQEKGFNLVALEAGWAEAAHINQAVVSGTDDPTTVRSRYRFFGGTSELWALIAWLQAYNQQAAAANRVSLSGFDMQYGDLLVQDTLTYIQQVDPGSLDLVQDDLRCFSDHVVNYSANPDADHYSQAGSEIQAECRHGLQAVHDLFLNNQAAYEIASSPNEYAEAFTEVRLLLQNEQLMAEGDMLASINLRDRYMADNAAWLLDQAGPTAKMVIWAHNGHVSAAHGQWSEAEAAAFGGATGQEMIPMGAYLRELYGDELVVVGFAFERGSFLAIGFSERINSALGYGIYNLPGPLPGSYEEYLATVSLPRFMLDLRLVQDAPQLADWFRKPRWMTVFGLGYVTDDPQANASRIILPDAFDILIYFQTTTAAQR